MTLGGVPAWWLAVHLAVAAAGTWLARRYAIRRALIDHPGERRSHQLPTPRGGGAGIVAALLLALAWLAWSRPALRPVLLAAATGLALVAGIGWADDHRPLPAIVRLLVHALAGALLGTGLWLFLGAPAWFGVLAALLALVLVNVWNFMDGIDALAASQAGIAGAGYLLLAGHGPVAWLAAALVAGCVAFLPFNLPRARVFLGDIGSGALGFALACVVALSCVRTRFDEWALLALLPLAPFGIDAGLTLASRILNGERWWEPHATHAYQRWARRAGHGTVALAYAAWTLAGVALMLWLPAGSGWSLAAAAGFVLCGAGAWWMARTKGNKQGNQGREGNG